MPSRNPKTVGGSLRQDALEILCAVEAGGFCDALLGRALAKGTLSPRDAGLLTRLTYGVLAWRDRLDWTLEPLSQKPFIQLDPEIRALLRLGLLQLLFLDRIPAHAAISTSVDLARTASGRGAGGLVNAILRRVQREGERPLPRGPKDAQLAIEFSHPRWLVHRWIKELGEPDARRLLAANQEAAPTTLRLLGANSRTEVLETLAAKNIQARAGEFSPEAIRLESPLGAVLADPHLRSLVPQSEASLLVGALVTASPGEKIADLCAAPGGKTEILGAGATATGLVIASDRAAGGLRRMATRGLTNLVRCDAATPPFRPHGFDGVLVDAPCSGLGTLRGHPEIRWRRSEEDVGRLAHKQAAILAGGATLVRPGGRLIYATCTQLEEENQQIVEGFLTQHPEFTQVPAGDFLPKEAAPTVNAAGYLETSPARDGLDGFFAARLHRHA